MIVDRSNNNDYSPINIGGTPIISNILSSVKKTFSSAPPIKNLFNSMVGSKSENGSISNFFKFSPSLY